MQKILNGLLVIFCLLPLTIHAQDAVISDVINFSQVSEGIYRGGRPENFEQIKELHDLGIRTVIDLQGGDVQSPWIGFVIPYVEAGETLPEINTERAYVQMNGMDFISAPLNSLNSITYAESKRIEEIMNIMNDPARQPVFVHCAHGADRTGLVVALYRMKYQRWSMTKAYQEMRAKGHNWLHTSFTYPLDKYFFTYGFLSSLQIYFGLSPQS